MGRDSWYSWVDRLLIELNELNELINPFKHFSYIYIIISDSCINNYVGV